MSGFKALRDISNKFESELQTHSKNTFFAKADESFEDVVAKKIEDISLLTSKLRLLQATTLSATPQIRNGDREELATINDYTEAVVWKLIEQQVVKTVTQAHSVKALITAPDRSLDPELLERKEKIIAQVTEYSQKEIQLLHLDGILKDKEKKLLEACTEWDKALGELKDRQNVPKSEERTTGRHHKHLQTLVDKMQLMRWVISKLVTSRTSDYDWAADPHKCLKALALTRQCYTIQSFTDA